MNHKLLPLALMVAGIFLFNHDLFLEDSLLVVAQSCQCFSFLCLTIGIGWIYTSVQGNPKRADLKILDWALIGFFLCIIPIFWLLELPTLFSAPLLPFLIAVRLFATWYLNKDDFQSLDLALFFTMIGVGIVLAIFGMMGFKSKSTGYAVLNPFPLLAVAICPISIRLIITWWKWKRDKGEI